MRNERGKVFVVVVALAHSFDLRVPSTNKVIETCSMNEEVGDFLDILGPFYEFLPEKENDSKQSKLANGKCLGEMNNNNNNNNSYHEETAADIVSSML